MAYIYRIVNDINGKDYIGKTMLDIEKRFKQHCLDSRKDRTANRPLYKAMNKYGVHNFHIELIEECADDIASEREVFWIERYGSFKNGYNATMGGDGKHYIDYDMIEYNYNIYKSMKEVARVMNISYDTVKIVLKQRHIPLINNASNLPIPVSCIDMETKEIIKTFASLSKAAKWLQDNNYTSAKSITGIATHINKVCKGERKTAYKFFWRYE